MHASIRNKTELLLALLYAGERDSKAPQISPPIEGITRLEKLIFLLKIQEGFLSEASDTDDFHFVAFRLGPWTNEVYDEVDFLESLGLLRKQGQKERSPADAAHDDELFSSLIVDKYQKQAATITDETEIFQLTEEGKNKALAIWNRLTDDEKKSIVSIKSRFNKMNLQQLLRYVYKQYPEYTTESEIKGFLRI